MRGFSDKEELKQQIDYLEKIKDFDGLTPGDEHWLNELKEELKEIDAQEGL